MIVCKVLSADGLAYLWRLLSSVCKKKARGLPDALYRIGSPPAPCIATPSHCLGVMWYVLRSL